MEKRVESTDETVEEIMTIHRSLPPRPGIDEVEAARALIQNVEKEDQARLEAIAKQSKSPNVPEELFMVLQEMQKGLVYFQSKEQKREALKLLDLENAYVMFDDLIQRASNCVSSSASASSLANKAVYSNGSSSPLSKSRFAPSVAELAVPAVAGSPSSLYLSGTETVNSMDLFTKDDSYVKKAKSTPKPRILDSTLQKSSLSGQDGEKLSLIKVASLIEASAKKGTRDLNLQNKLMDNIEWLPDSIGKLSSLVTLDLSENRIMILPNTVGGLASLIKLDLHSNRISQLPESFGNMLSLVYLNLSCNQLSSLPPIIGRLVRLEELDLSSNNLRVLPESIGSLICLKKLNVETNDLEELPHTIGQCSSLKELLADYNRLKALPEAVGKIETLEVLSVRYNNVRQMPTTMSSLTNLKELDASFNELESLPESLCFATSLVKLNIGNNFADMRSLPISIGNLEMLEELDISNNQIHILPDSFRMLKQLRVLRVEENPLEVPPRQIAEMGAQAVVQYMTELVEKRDAKVQPVKQKKGWAQMCCFTRSNKRRRNNGNYVNT